jgi:F-type H+-transporting ATPase subunit alpha
MPVEQQVVTLFAGTRGYLDTVDVSEVQRFEAELLEWVSARNSSLLSGIRDSGNVDADELDAAVKAFAAQFVSHIGGPAGAEPDGGAAGANTARVSAPTHLPEDETTLVDDEA